MMFMLKFVSIVFVSLASLNLSYSYFVPSFVSSRSISNSQSLYLFNFWRKRSSNEGTPVPTITANVDRKKVEQMRGKLEKISNKQKRDYDAEAKARQAPPAPPRDLQKKSGPNDFPNLYKGWIAADGDQIGKQIISSSVAAIKKKEKYMEVLFDPGI